MTFREYFAVLYGRGNRPVSREKIRTVLKQIIALPADQHACWVEYRDRRLGRVSQSPAGARHG